MQKIIYLSIINNMTSYNFGTGLDFTGSSSEAYPDVSELIAAISNIQENIDTVLGIGDITVVVADVATAKSNITTQTGRVSVASNAIVALNVRTSNLEDNLVLLDNIVDHTNSDLLDLENSLVNYATLTTTQTLKNKTLSYNSNTFLNFPTTDLTPLQNSISDINNEILTNAADIVNLDLRLDTDEVTIQTNTNKIITNSNNISSNLQKIIQNSNNIFTNSNNLFTVASNLSNESKRIDTSILNNIALNLRVDSTNMDVDDLDSRIVVIESASNSYLTSTNTKTVSNKTFDYNTNTFLNFPTGGGGGATGDVTLAGTQTLTNKTIDYTTNTLLNLPQFDDSSIQSTLTTLDGRIDDNDTDVATLFTLTTANSNSVASLSNAVASRITGLSNAVATTITNLPFYNDTDIRSDLTAVEGRVDAVELDITSLDNRLDTVETAAPTYVTLTGTQTVTNKTFNYADNTFNGFPTSGGGSGDVTLTGAQTLTNKTMAFANNTFTGFPTFDDTTIQSSLTDLDNRLDLAEDDITDTNNAVIAANAQITINSNNLVGVSNTVNSHTSQIATNTSAISTNTSGITTLNTNYTSLSNALSNDILNLVGVSNTVNTHTSQIATNTTGISTNNTNLTTLSNAYNTRINTNTSQISTNTSQISTNTTDISNRVIAPATNSANYIPQWNGTANSKTLVNGIDISTITTLTGSQTLTNKTIDYNTNTFLNLPSGGGGGGFTPSASNITVVNSNIPVSVLNIDNSYKFRANVSASYLTGGTVYKIINFNTKTYDLNNNFSNSTYKYTVPITGYYDINSMVCLSPTTVSVVINLSININTVSLIVDTLYTSSTASTNYFLEYNDKLLLNANDVVYIEVYVPNAAYNVIAGSFWSMNLVSSATPATIPIVTTTNINAYSYTMSGSYTPSVSNITVVNSNIPVSVLNISNPYKFRAYLLASQTLTANTSTTITFNTKTYDLNNNFNTSTYKYTVPITGYYDIDCMFRCLQNTSVEVQIQLEIYINNVFYNKSMIGNNATGNPTFINYNDRILLNVGDTVHFNGICFSSGLVVIATSYFAMNLINPDVASNIPIVTTTNINAYSYSGSGNIMTGQTNSNNYIPVWSSNNSTYLNNGISVLDLTAYNLKSATTTVNVATATAPASNMVLKATSASNAIWDYSYKIFNPYRLNAYLSAQVTQAVGDNKILIDAINTDPMSGWDSTNKRYTIPITGYYRCYANICITGYAINSRHSIFFKLGTVTSSRTEGCSPNVTAQYFTMQGETIINATAGNYVELWAYIATAGGAGTKIFNDTSKYYSYFTIEYVGS